MAEEFEFNEVKEIYQIKWKSYNFQLGEQTISKTFHDVQWKEYGVRATNDDDGETLIIPYFRIYEIGVIQVE